MLGIRKSWAGNLGLLIRRSKLYTTSEYRQYSWNSPYFLKFDYLEHNYNLLLGLTSSGKFLKHEDWAWPPAHNFVIENLGTPDFEL